MVSQPLNAGLDRPKSPRRHRRSSALSRPLSGTVQASRTQPLDLKLKSAHPRSQHSAWAEHLAWWKQISTGMAILSGVSVLSLYSWTVHTQSRWSQRYQVWQQMQRNERQFLLTQESIANSLREIADRSEMVPLVPDRMIEVPIASPSQVEPDPAHQATALPERALRAAHATEKTPLFYPVGY